MSNIIKLDNKILAFPIVGKHVDDFQIGDFVSWLDGAGQLTDLDGIVMAKNTKDLSILFEDELHEKTVNPCRLVITYRKNENSSS